MAIPQKIQVQAPAIATYEYTDIESGLGYVDFYAATENLSGSTAYVLSDDATIYSGDIELSNSCGGSPMALINTYNFDSSLFNLPRTVKGRFYVNAGHNIDLYISEKPAMYVTYTLQKYDGSTATDIATVTSATITDYAADEDKIFYLGADCTQTDILTGEQLRLNVKIYASGSGSGTSTANLGIDPQNRDGVHITPSADDNITQLKVKVPFKIII